MRTALGIFLFAILAALAVLFFSSDRGEVRRITAATATSDCIGEPKTPMCTTETWLACQVRPGTTLCKVAAYGREYPPCLDDNRLPGCENLNFQLDEGWNNFFGDLRYRVALVRDLRPAEKNDGQIKDPPPSKVIEVDRWICPLPGQAKETLTRLQTRLPTDAPSDGFFSWLRAQGRRIQTVLWEWGIVKEPFDAVWYEMGADYCWEPAQYWVGQKDSEWRLVKWTTDGGECESADGCPEWRWPPYRKIIPPAE